jgi:hypothetical protein
MLVYGSCPTYSAEVSIVAKLPEVFVAKNVKVVPPGPERAGNRMGRKKPVLVGHLDESLL